MTIFDFFISSPRRIPTSRDTNYSELHVVRWFANRHYYENIRVIRGLFTALRLTNTIPG